MKYKVVQPCYNCQQACSNYLQGCHNAIQGAIPNLGIQAKPKAVKLKFEGTNVSMPAPPSKKVLAELDSSMVEHGELEIGIPCANHY